MPTRRALTGWLCAGFLIVVGGLGWPLVDAGAAPLPRATPSASPAVEPSPSESIPDENDDGSNLTPESNGTMLALGGAVALALGAGAVVLIRRG
ncbi:MAG: hypothetical protein WAS07_13815 [Micropruina sp.]|nr:hypothetical protein [Micropruina sp.]